MMRSLVIPAAALVCACSWALGGCAASASPAWDAHLGESTRILHAQQLIDPAAPTRNGQTSPKGDGRTIHEAQTRHVDTYRAPPPSSVTNISVGGSAAP